MAQSEILGVSVEITQDRRCCHLASCAGLTGVG
jgi:hypothetical protein